MDNPEIIEQYMTPEGEIIPARVIKNLNLPDSVAEYQMGRRSRP